MEAKRTQTWPLSYSSVNSSSILWQIREHLKSMLLCYPCCHHCVGHLVSTATRCIPLFCNNFTATQLYDAPEIKQVGHRHCGQSMSPDGSIDRKTESLIRAAGDGASIDSALSINPRGSTLQSFEESRVRSTGLEGSAFHSSREAKRTCLHAKSRLADVSRVY